MERKLVAPFEDDSGLISLVELAGALGTLEDDEASSVIALTAAAGLFPPLFAGDFRVLRIPSLLFFSVSGFAIVAAFRSAAALMRAERLGAIGINRTNGDPAARCLGP